MESSKSETVLTGHGIATYAIMYIDDKRATRKKLILVIHAACEHKEDKERAFILEMRRIRHMAYRSNTPMKWNAKMIVVNDPDTFKLEKTGIQAMFEANGRRYYTPMNKGLNESYWIDAYQIQTQPQQQPVSRAEAIEILKELLE